MRSDVAAFTASWERKGTCTPIPATKFTPRRWRARADEIDGKTTNEEELGNGISSRPELVYFSDCILNDTQPEPSGEEGLQDVRIVEALYRSARRQRPVSIRPFFKRVRPTLRQRISRPGVKKPRLVKVQSASR